jgi:hypothetical protein
MSGASAGASAAAAAAAAARAREEEEELTPYTPHELANDWEFKILRSSLGQFRNSRYLAEVLEEEARAGWTLVEKFDNGRIRLKRPARARELDGKLNFDPYRTTVGASQEKVVLLIVAAVLAIFFGAMLLLMMMKR